MTTFRLLFERQTSHLISLVLLLLGLLAASHLPGFREGQFLAVKTDSWVVLAVASAVVHQVFVWFCWRAELHAGLLTRVLGRAAFGTYAVIFAVLILARPVLVTALAISNADTLNAPAGLRYVLTAMALVPPVYLLYSVKRYFGFRRAFGIDHFDDSYRTMLLVRKGAFRYSQNAMYTLGLLGLWVPGLLLDSMAAVTVALFSHLYIWIHYAFTERPDMERIYGSAVDLDKSP